MGSSAELHNLELTRKELVALYMMLASSEDELDACQLELYRRVSQVVYSVLSVEELEQIEAYYGDL